jgi:hypothetical protein
MLGWLAPVVQSVTAIVTTILGYSRWFQWWRSVIAVVTRMLGLLAAGVAKSDSYNNQMAEWLSLVVAECDCYYNQLVGWLSPVVADCDCYYNQMVGWLAAVVVKM